MMRRTSTLTFGVLCAIALAAGACRETAAPDVTPTALTLLPVGTASLAVGATLTLSVRATNRSGTGLNDLSVTWASSDRTVATVSSSGMVTATRLGSATITAAVGSALSASAVISVVPGAPAMLVLRTAPAGAAAGVALVTQPVLEVRDSSGNIVTSANVTVTATLSTTSGALLNASVAAVEGVATFTSLTVTGSAGPATIIFSAPALPSVTAAQVQLAAGPAAKLVVRSIPSAAPGWTPLAASTVDVRDAWDNLVSSSATIHADIATGGGVLSGATFAQAASGVATFGNIAVIGAGGDRTLRFTSPGLLSAASPPVAIASSAFISVTSSAMDDGQTCGLSGTGVAYCWGRNDKGQLGDGTTIPHLIPTPVGGGLTFSTIVGGGDFACGLTSGGSAYCWGGNDFLQLGDGTGTSRRLPTPVVGGLKFTSLSAGFGHVCGLVADGHAYCWGLNLFSRLGDGTDTDRGAPTAVGGGLTFVQLAAGGTHTCGIASDGRAYCWGQNNYGEIGNGTVALGLTATHSEVGVALPTLVTTAVPFVQILPGTWDTCALDATGKAYCWGLNLWGELGDGTTTNRSLPVPALPAQTFTSISAGAYSACGVAADALTYCWGLTGLGSPSSVAVGVGARYAAVAVSYYHTCAVTRDGSLYCWGGNADGQLGDGTTVDRSVPTPVIKP
jgi:hypothetical protein